jgi:hypothetical protein
MGRVYGGKQMYENGLGAKRQARAMVIMTTGSGPDAYGGRGVHASLNSILAPIQHGVFWFNGFQPLNPFVAWSVAHVAEAERRAYLDQLRTRMKNIFEEAPQTLPRLADFSKYGRDTKLRFGVIVSRKSALDKDYLEKIPDERKRVAELRRIGFIVDAAFSPPDAENWRGFLSVRAASLAEVEMQLMTLPLAKSLEFEIHHIE